MAYNETIAYIAQAFNVLSSRTFRLYLSFNIKPVITGHSLLPDFFLDEISPKKIAKHLEQFGNTPRFSPDGKVNQEPQELGKVGRVFETVEAMLNEEIVQQMKAVYSFNLKGNNEWVLLLGF